MGHIWHIEHFVHGPVTYGVYVTFATWHMEHFVHGHVTYWSYVTYTHVTYGAFCPWSRDILSICDILMWHMEHFVHGQHTVYVRTCLSFLKWLKICGRVNMCDHNTSTSTVNDNTVTCTVMYSTCTVQYSKRQYSIMYRTFSIGGPLFRCFQQFYFTPWKNEPAKFLAYLKPAIIWKVLGKLKF